MPNTNCCVPLYHATSKRHTQLSWHALPIDPKLNNKQPTVAISNDTLKVNSRGTSACGLHFQGERRTHDVNTRLRYSHVPFKKLVSKFVYVSHTNECCLLNNTYFSRGGNFRYICEFGFCAKFSSREINIHCA